MGCLGRRHCRGHSFCPTGEVGGVTASLRKHRVSSQVRAVVTRGGSQEGLIQRSDLIVNIVVNRLLMWAA